MKSSSEWNLLLLLARVTPFDKVCTVTCRMTSFQKADSALCSWQKKAGFELLGYDYPESYLELAVVAFLWDRPFSHSISIHCAKVFAAFFPFAELAFPLLLGSAHLNVDITATATQTSSRIFSTWFGLSLLRGRIPWIPSGC